MTASRFAFLKEDFGDLYIKCIEKESVERENNKSSKGSGCLGTIFFWIIIAFIIIKILG